MEVFEIKEKPDTSGQASGVVPRFAVEKGVEYPHLQMEFKSLTKDKLKVLSTMLFSYSIEDSIPVYLLVEAKTNRVGYLKRQSLKGLVLSSAFSKVEKRIALDSAGTVLEGDMILAFCPLSV